MLGWLYDIFVTIVSFIMSLFGFDLKKRSVHFEDEVETKKERAENTNAANTNAANTNAAINGEEAAVETQ